MKNVLLCIAAGLLLAHCGGNSAPVIVEPKLSDIEQKIFKPSCALSTACHQSARASTGNMNLSAGASFAQIVGVAVDNPAAGAAAKKRVVAGSPDQSFLVQKILGTGLSLCTDDRTPSPRLCNEGFRMPDQSPQLPQQHIDAIRTWITNGALNN